MILTLIGMSASAPLGVLLALARRAKMPLLRTLAIGYIELVRGVPLLTVLFVATFIFPLVLPPGWRIDPFWRVVIGMVLFQAAYMAETVRGGLQTLPRGQLDAGTALGLSYPQLQLSVVLPQALAAVIPAFVNNLLSTFMDTSLVTVVSHVRPDRRAAPGAGRPEVARLLHRGLPLHRRDLLRLLPRDVALQPVARPRVGRSDASQTRTARPAADPIIDLARVNKWYGAFHVLRDIDLDVERGERIVICGPSGSGKSTLIRCINRLETVQAGRIVVDGIDLTADVQERRLGAAGSRHGVPAVQPVSAPDHSAELHAGADAFAWPEQGRGGDHRHEIPQSRAYSGAGPQIPRPALGWTAAARGHCARAVHDPKIMLFDEPTSALDPEMVKEVLDVMVEPGRRGHDDAVCHPRDGFAQASPTGWSSWTRAGSSRRRRRKNSSATRSTSGRGRS